eukprot:Skav222852  [mRNA]  locus=scaffold850:399733:400958:- [translate_table: standard]
MIEAQENLAEVEKIKEAIQAKLQEAQAAEKAQEKKMKPLEDKKDLADRMEKLAEQSKREVDFVEKLRRELEDCLQARARFEEMSSAQREECDQINKEVTDAKEDLRKTKELIYFSELAMKQIAKAEAKKVAEAKQKAAMKQYEIARIIQESDKQANPIPFFGSEDEHFVEGKDAIVSFPGVHGYGWKKLTAISSSKETPIVTSCIFLPDQNAPGYGCHDLQRGGPCNCHALYGKEEEWGCHWFTMWKNQTQTAALAGCNLIVVTKKDGSLGNSQKGEVKFLEARKLKYEEITIEKFARKILGDSADEDTLAKKRQHSVPARRPVASLFDSDSDM